MWTNWFCVDQVWELVSGHEDVYIHSSMIKKWDICAGAAILNSLGGRLTDADGKDIDFKNKWEYKHESGLIAAKYDQPEYVAAIKHLSTLEDWWLPKFWFQKFFHFFYK